MSISVGDIVWFQSSVAGKAKYHFCFFFNDQADRYSLILLNSEGEYDDHFVIDCTRLPNMPASRTGKTIFSCPTVIRKSPEQIRLLNPSTKCIMPRDVAYEFLVFARGIRGMTVNDKARLIATLQSLCQ